MKWIAFFSPEQSAYDIFRRNGEDLSKSVPRGGAEEQENFDQRQQALLRRGKTTQLQTAAPTEGKTFHH